MGALEAVFNSTKFDLNDEVLMRFDDYFDKRDRAYNSFSLDDEEDIIFYNRNSVLLIFFCHRYTKYRLGLISRKVDMVSRR